MKVERLDPDTPSSHAMIAELDAYMATLYAIDRDPATRISALKQRNVELFGAFVDDALVGCGAVKFLEDDGRYAEIKSVFVAEAQRRRGYSKTIMQALETHLVAAGIDVVRLATGTKQPAAIALYESLGYVYRPPFGGYATDSSTVYMEKILGR